MDDLVLLHAFPLDSRMWSLPAVTPDLRGHGEPSLDVLAADVIAELDSRGLNRVVLGGCSMGGYVAMAVARLAPERVKGLVFVDTKHVADGVEAIANRHAMADRVEREGVGQWLVDATVPNLVAPDASAQVRERVASIVLEQDPADVAWKQRAMALRPDSADVLGELDVPSLVVVGEFDPLTPPEVAKSLAAVLRHSTFVEVAGAGHLPPVEKPEEFATLVRDWLAG